MCHPNAEVHTEKVDKAFPEAPVARRHKELKSLGHPSQKNQAHGLDHR